VEVIADFLCSACQLLEAAQAENLRTAAEAGQIRLIVHPVGYLVGDNDDYSKRSVLAAVTVAALEPELFWNFYEALWGAQPSRSETATDLTDEQIAAVARSIGVSEATTEQFVDSPVAAWTQWSTAEGIKRLERGTPEIFMSYNGSDPAVWQSWVLSGTDESGQEVLIRGDLDKAIANVKAGKAPDAE
jgi:hypothetical protein